MRDAYWIPRVDRSDQELQRPFLYAPSPYDVPAEEPERETEADGEDSERVVIIEI